LIEAKKLRRAAERQIEAINSLPDASLRGVFGGLVPPDEK